MEAIISAVITGVVTIIAAVITYQVKISKMMDNTSQSNRKCDKLLEKSDNLSEKSNNLSGEHKQLLMLSSDVKSAVCDIGKTVSEEKTKQELRYGNLTDKQKDIMASVKNIEAVAGEMARLQTELSNLERENSLLKLQISELTQSKTLSQRLDDAERRAQEHSKSNRYERDSPEL